MLLMYASAVLEVCFESSCCKCGTRVSGSVTHTTACTHPQFSNCVVDRERISGLPGGAVADCMATYFVGSHGKIVKFLMLWRPAA